MKTLFVNANAVLPDQTKLTNILCEDGVIVNIKCDTSTPCDQIIDVKGNYLLAGFVDVHLHGGGGADFMDGDVDSMQLAAKTHLEHGTTTLFPTTMSATWDEIENTVQVYKDFVKNKDVPIRLGGLHLEGPFLSIKMSGAQRSDLIYTPTEEHVEFIKANKEYIKRITCAPEEDGVIAMAKELLQYGISFSMGHTMATYECGEEAFNNGFSSITHCYSATSGFHKVNQKVHIGITQLAYGLDDIYVELIGDGCHVPKELLRLMLKVKGGDKICLVTDSMRAAGTNVTESFLGAKVPENRVIIDDGVAKLPDKSFFAGSIATMDIALRFAVQKAGVPIEVVSKLISLNPAKLMGLDKQIGSIEQSKLADFVVADKDLNIKDVYVNGVSIYK